jgi:hypothetical protein
VYMDWGLGRPKYGFLGTSLMYPHKYYYYWWEMMTRVPHFQKLFHT